MIENSFVSPSHALKYWLDKNSLTAYQLAKDSLLTQSTISEILSGKRRITTETATILGAHFGNGADYWLSIQLKSDSLKAETNSAIRYESMGDLSIGSYSVRCYVLPDESCVISAEHFFMFFGINSTTVGPKRLASLIDSPFLRSKKMGDIRKRLLAPLKIADERGAFTFCYEGELVIDFCQAILDLRRLPEALPNWAIEYAKQAEIVITSVAKVGIVALIQEATGFQARRHRTALQELLDVYFVKEGYGKWTKRFPDWFYEEIFRLNGWEWKSISDTKRPPLIGKITKDIVYSRLESGVINELERRNPLLADGSRKIRHHQLLSDETGHPALDRHFYALRGLFRSHKTWKGFMHALRLAHPRKNEIVQMELEDYTHEW